MKFQIGDRIRVFFPKRYFVTEIEGIDNDGLLIVNDPVQNMLPKSVHPKQCHKLKSSAIYIGPGALDWLNKDGKCEAIIRKRPYTDKWVKYVPAKNKKR